MKSVLNILLTFVFSVHLAANTIDYDKATIEKSRSEKELSKHNYFKSLYYKNNHTVLKSNKLVIPKIIHQIWIGPKPLPKKFKSFISSWKKMHPGWEYKLWTNKDLENFPWKFGKAAFDRAKNYGAKGDILRFEILYEYGGLYADLDFECIRPLDKFHYGADMYLGAMNGRTLNGALMASKPKAKIFETMLKTLEGKDLEKNPVVTTGPHLVTNSIYKHKDSQDGFKIAVYPQMFFYPFPHTKSYAFWGGKLSIKDVKEHCSSYTHGIHYWAVSWKK